MIYIDTLLQMTFLYSVEMLNNVKLILHFLLTSDILEFGCRDESHF